MPAVKRRAGDDISQRPEIPSQIRVQEKRVEREDRRNCRERRAAKSHQVQRDHLEDASENLIHRMQPRRREPIDVLGTVMNRVKLPEQARMKQPMGQIPEEVAEDEELEDLHREWLLREPRR